MFNREKLIARNDAWKGLKRCHPWRMRKLLPFDKLIPRLHQAPSRRSY
jgi:hypothetical protein